MSQIRSLSPLKGFRFHGVSSVSLLNNIDAERWRPGSMWCNNNLLRLQLCQICLKYAVCPKDATNIIFNSETSWYTSPECSLCNMSWNFSKYLFIFLDRKEKILLSYTEGKELDMCRSPVASCASLQISLLVLHNIMYKIMFALHYILTSRTHNV